MAKKHDDKQSMVLYFEWLDHLSMLTDAEAMAVLRAVRTYIQTRNAPALSGAAGMAFAFIKAQTDRDIEKWDNEKQRRSAAGKLGAAVTNSKRQSAATDASAEPETANDASAEPEAANSAVNVNEHEHVDVHVHVHKKDRKEDRACSPSPCLSGPPGDDRSGADADFERRLMAPFRHRILQGGGDDAQQ